MQHPSEDYFPWLLDELMERLEVETGRKRGPLANDLGVGERTVYGATANRSRGTRRTVTGSIGPDRLAILTREGLRLSAITAEMRDRIWYAWLRRRLVAQGGAAAEDLVRRNEDAHGAPHDPRWRKERRRLVELVMRENEVTDS